ncbi:MAG: hypothetical protein K5637_06440 [Lachnospiraceae bacterium]|nr:hypothetical protein [Lachnospiraceae bacterium]
MKNGLFKMTLAAFAASAVLISGCSQSSSSSQAQPETESESAATETAAETEMSAAEKAEISERAINNFLSKLEEGNYVMSVDGYMKTVVSSGDLVYFDYEDDETYSDFAVMSVNGEVFQGLLEGDAVSDVSYLTEGRALDAAESRLPNYWMAEEVSQGNIFNLFYNDMENPLKFISNDENVKNQVRTFAGYGELSLNYMHEVYLILDQEDPTVAHIQAEFDDDEVARYYFDDLDAVITFGDAGTDERAVSWMQAPEYPEALTEWGDEDLFVFDSVFLPGYGEDAIPFPSFASYALSVDYENFVYDDKVYIRDAHATEEDLQAYAEVLKQNGYEEAVIDDSTVYLKLIRPETDCYAMIELENNSGMDLTASKHYDYPTYTGADEINTFISSKGYPELPAGEALTDLDAVDTKNENSESWLYFYDYETVLYVYANYSDYDKAVEYLDSYAEELTSQGFEYNEADDYYYQSGNEGVTFRYHLQDDETVILLYKAEKLLSEAEAEAQISGVGFPEMDLSAYTGGRDHRKFLKTMYGKNYASAITVSLTFDTSEEADAFLDEYAERLDEDDFMRVPASAMSSNKNNCYTNEEKGLGVAFDFLPANDGGETYINFEFRSGIDFSEDTDEDEEGTTPILGSQNALDLASDNFVPEN